jgi:ComF family protein
LFHPGGEFSGLKKNKGASAPLNFADAMDRYFCPDCRDQWTEVKSPLCSRCGAVFNSREGEDHLCGRCLERPGAFTKARSLGIYDQSLRIAIHALKFKEHSAIAKPLGEILFHVFHRHWAADGIEVVSPVPLHRRRFKERGFNQAQLLIRKWPLPDKMSLVRDLLVRTRATAPQTGLNRKQRKTNIKHAFAVKKPGLSKGKRILLVDDVLTTGETADACAHTLLRDGARQVDVLTLARAM